MNEAKAKTLEQTSMRNKNGKTLVAVGLRAETVQQPPTKTRRQCGGREAFMQVEHLLMLSHLNDLLFSEGELIKLLHPPCL